ncbi:NADPH oxidase activator 1 isoform 1 [Camelus ferus]|nr:NADPH oxidase activator 1 isoform 1 [Camelus ferus]
MQAGTGSPPRAVRDPLRHGVQGAQAVERGDWDCALRLFSGIPEPPARLCFNVGCVHLLAGDPEAALQVSRGPDDQAPRGFWEALSDFQLALAQLRDNATIDYTQLGLRFKLQAWGLGSNCRPGRALKVRFNMAAVQCQLGLWAEATCSLEKAISQGPDGARDDLDVALGQVQKQAPLQPRQVPGGEVFRPHRRRLEHLEPVDFLGKAKVAWSPGACGLPGQGQASGHGDFGVQGRHPGPADPLLSLTRWWPALSLMTSMRTSSLSSHRACDNRPYRAGTLCDPRTPLDAEMEVSAGQAGQADPCTLATSDEQGTPVEQAGQQVPPGEGIQSSGWQCAFTLALKAPRGADLSSLRALLSQALPPQAQHGQLRYRDPGDDRCWVPLTGEEALQRAWQTLTLPQGVGGRPVLYQVVAQHSYRAQGPEDLGLRPGDTVDVLCEVDQAWLEGHCDGRIGIFPKCFVVPAGRRT